LGDKNGNSGPITIALGQNAGFDGQANAAIAIGQNAGAGGQGAAAITIGQDAGGNITQGANAVAIGTSAGFDAQGIGAVAIGSSAGQIIQGINSVAIGANAGVTNQGNNSIILNATGANLNQTTANTFTVAPVRNDNSNIAEVMFYNTTSKEVTYGNTLSVAGNITASNFIGNLVYTPKYGSFYDTTTQTNTDVGNAIPISYNTTANSNGISITGTGNTEIRIANAGIYNIQFSVQVLKTDAGSDTVYIWLDKNGSSVANSATGLFLVGSNAAEVAAWNFVVNAAADDYYRLMWMSADSHVNLVAVAAGAVVPAIPSVILTVVPVGT
jgi:hypothetical protein